MLRGFAILKCPQEIAVWVVLEKTDEIQCEFCVKRGLYIGLYQTSRKENSNNRFSEMFNT
jgi:hypothetical protein